MLTRTPGLDDLCVRFIINLPQEELESVARICFQVEEAQWFYEDFVRPIDPSLPSLNLKQFCLKIFQHCPLLSAFSDEQHLAAYQDFLGYKTRVPVRGAIMLNHDMDKVVLVKGWKSNASWSFPRGKINKDEKDLDCAVREVYEETGYDIYAAGLVPEPDEVKAIDVTMREQHMRLFVFRSVPEDTLFEPKTRKEISKIQWYRLADLPTLKKNKQTGQSDAHENYNPSKFYMVAPFLGPLKKWIHKQKKIEAQQALHDEYGDELPSEAYVEEQPSQLPEINTAAGVMQDPASELKRLLSVQMAPPHIQESVPTQISQPNQQQTSNLLAMLRGDASSGHQTHHQTILPHTPLEQIGGPNMMPSTPHVHHVRESPFATRQPPPQFSPQAPQDPPIHHADGRAAYNGSGPPGPNLSAPQQNLLQLMQQSNQDGTPRGGQEAYLHQHRSSQTSQAHSAAIQTHLPSNPPVNTHAQNLLNAFKAAPPQTHNASLLDTLKNNPPPRNAHQNSLLDLFKSTGGPSASIASPPPAGVLGSPMETPKPSQSLPGSSKRPEAATTRRPSAAHMINRALPKAKPKSRQPSAPSMDATNFPTLGSLSLRQPGGVTSPDATSTIANPVPKQMTILARPEQPMTSALPSSRPQSRGKQFTPTPISILQRPGSSSSGSREHAAIASYKPQILNRGDPTITSPAISPPLSSLSNDANESAKSGLAQQRDNLLSLFAQSQRTVSSPPSVQPSNQTAPLSTWAPSVAAPTIASHPIRQSSVASLSGEGSGAKSPSTPSETRGFLMDYLDGVLKGAK